MNFGCEQSTTKDAELFPRARIAGSIRLWPRCDGHQAPRGRVFTGLDCAEIRNKVRNKSMNYTRPQITGNFRAVSSIQSEKGEGQQEISDVFLTNGAAYQADE